MPRGWAAAACLLAVSSAGNTASASPPGVIVFGGGWGPESNQVSLEAQVLALSDVLRGAQPFVLFGGPEPRSGTRSVQVTETRTDEIGALLGLVFDRATGIDVAYRKAQIRDKPATRAALLAAIGKSRGRPAIVFGVGHGTYPEDSDARLDLWGPSTDALTRTDLRAALDRAARKAPTAFVLGQCYSGAFTALVYRDGQAGSPLAAPARCVLAAVPGDRESSGCTSDVRDPAARAYMALIAEAFARRASSDADRDGVISIAEAHAYARVHDRTINVPVSSSETWLRDALGDGAPAIAPFRISDLLARARPSERVVLEGLRPDLAKGPASTAGDVERSSTKIAAQIEALSREVTELGNAVDAARQRLQAKLYARWPELSNPYHRRSRALLGVDAADVVRFLRRQPELQALRKASAAHGAKDEALEELERTSARLERWLRAAEIVAFEQAVRDRDAPGSAAALDAILACEALSPQTR